MLKMWAIKNKGGFGYWSASGSASTAPTVYLSEGKAKGRCKQLYPRGLWEVVEWTITETALETTKQ
jgi:hypothetical protein